jgi:hypothetical protein
MKLGDLLWASHEFMKLYAEKPDLTLVASEADLDECIRGIGFKFSHHIAPDTTLCGMKIEKVSRGWHVRDKQGNTIGR